MRTLVIRSVVHALQLAAISATASAPAWPQAPAHSGFELVIHVPRDQPTIQAGVDAAADGDVVVVSDGTYTGAGNWDIEFHGKSIVLRAENGPNPVVIDCQATIFDPHRGFLFQSGEGPGAVVEGFTVVNGMGSFLPDDVGYAGGAVVCLQASPTFRRCTFRENRASNWGGGGAFFCRDASPTLIDCWFVENDASDASNGGGLALDGSSPLLVRCTFERNLAYFGGALYCVNGSAPRIRKCTFRENRSIYDGGALRCIESSPLIEDSLFHGNEGGEGGAIYAWSASLVLRACTLEENEGRKGGALFLTRSDPLVEDCRFAGNRAGEDGGALYHDNLSGGSVRACTFAANRASRGGALFCNRSQPLVAGNRFEDNRADGAAYAANGLSAGGALYCLLAAPTLQNNLFLGNEAEVYQFDFRALSRGGALYLEDSDPVLGGPAGGGNKFLDNRALVGMDVFKDGGAARLDARSNTFTIFPVSSLYLTPLVEFDVSIGAGLRPAITTDVTVSPSGVDVEGAPGPVRTLGFALSRMAPSARNPLTIRVEPGTYSPGATGESFPLRMIAHVKLQGPGADLAILDAEGTNRVILCASVADVELSGLTIRGGMATSGGGILCVAASPLIRANRVEANSGTWGGGIACFAGSVPLIAGNEIVWNTTLDSPYFAKLGGGVFCELSSPVLERNVIAFNESYDSGGGIACNQGSNPVLRNNTLARNTAPSGDGLVAWNGSHPTFVNCVLWEQGTAISDCCGSASAASYSDVAGGWPGTGNLAADPLFVDASAGDLRLSSGSPCIDAGDPASALDPDGTVADIGALPVSASPRTGRR